MADLQKIVAYLDAELRTSEVPDYDAALNGLQLVNDGKIGRIAAAVDFSADTVAGAVREHATLLIVHHGMFWRGAHRLVGPSFERLRGAIQGNLAIYSSHIPLDLHAVYGNNVLLAKELNLAPDGTFGRYRGVEIGVTGSCDLATKDVFSRLREFSAKYATMAVATPITPERRTKRWAIITGAGASSDSLAEASERGVDTLIVGEGAHHTAVHAMEHGLAVFYGGHYATETLGVRAVAAQVSERFEIPWAFVNVPTGL
jgi:dinuclear metal center YbgI/SA1388 family protein